MPSPTTLKSLGASILQAAKGVLGAKYGDIKAYLAAESEKLAITLRMIVSGVASGEVTPAEAKILLNQQKVASGAVLTAAEGMTAIAAQTAIEAGLAAVRDFINGKIGFALL